ncbi:Protein of unknown function, partial [Gryllus bimaculatus]
SLNNDRTLYMSQRRFNMSSEVEEFVNVTHSENSVCTFSSQYGLYIQFVQCRVRTLCSFFFKTSTSLSSRVVPKEHPLATTRLERESEFLECVILHNPSTLFGLKKLRSEMYRCFLEHNIDYTNIDYTQHIDYIDFKD